MTPEEIKVMYDELIARDWSPDCAMLEVTEYGPGLIDIFDALELNWIEDDIDAYIDGMPLSEILTGIEKR